MARREKAEDVQTREQIGESGDDREEQDDLSLPDLEHNAINRPDLLAALQGRDRYILMQCLPQAVKRRVKALKKLQLETTNIEAKFFDEVHELECKYHEKYTNYYEKRELIISGLYDPNDDECDFPSDEEDGVERDTDPKVDDGKNEDVAGIPDFWLTIFKNVAMLGDMVQPHDEPILKHLLDIKVVFLSGERMGFVLEFHFSPNEYFTNAVLSKEYQMKCKPDPADPFSFEGPEIYKCKGTPVDWYKGKNVTIKLIKKKQKHKSKGAVRTVTKTVQNDSFFNFFSPPYQSDDPDVELDEDTQALLTSDFEIGHYIRERIVPRAVLYFTGEALEDEEEYDDEEVEADEEEEDEEEEVVEGETSGDNEPAEKPKSGAARKTSKATAHPL